MYSGVLCSDEISTQRIVAREPVARNLVAAMNPIDQVPKGDEAV
jgi:hypothetical protein